VSPRVVALVAARDEEERIAACVSALVPLVGEVVVVDDGSRDATAASARRAGATVIRSARHRGKGRALEGALARLAPAEVWLFADGDLGSTAASLGPVLERVTSGGADLAIAIFPPARAGGFGLV
jgi:glycosyltransferase involved in cell wall biosynthesis